MHTSLSPTHNKQENQEMVHFYILSTSMSLLRANTQPNFWTLNGGHNGFRHTGVYSPILKAATLIRAQQLAQRQFQQILQIMCGSHICCPCTLLCVYYSAPSWRLQRVLPVASTYLLLFHSHRFVCVLSNPVVPTQTNPITYNWDLPAFELTNLRVRPIWFKTPPKKLPSLS